MPLLAGTMAIIVLFGDHLLVQGSWAALEQCLSEPDLLVVDSPKVVRREAVPMGRGAWTAIAIMVAMTNTGAGQQLAEGLVSMVGMVGDASPYALLTGLFVLTAIMGQLISKTAAPDGTAWSVPGGDVRSGPARHQGPGAASAPWLPRSTPTTVATSTAAW